MLYPLSFIVMWFILPALIQTTWVIIVSIKLVSVSVHIYVYHVHTHMHTKWDRTRCSASAQRLHLNSGPHVPTENLAVAQNLAELVMAKWRLGVGTLQRQAHTNNIKSKQSALTGLSLLGFLSIVNTTLQPHPNLHPHMLPYTFNHAHFMASVCTHSFNHVHFMA